MPSPVRGVREHGPALEPHKGSGRGAEHEPAIISQQTAGEGWLVSVKARVISEYLKYLPGCRKTTQESNRVVYTQAGSECSGHVMNWGVERIGGKKSGALCKGGDKPRTPLQVWGLNTSIN